MPLSCHYSHGSNLCVEDVGVVGFLSGGLDHVLLRSASTRHDTNPLISGNAVSIGIGTKHGRDGLSALISGGQLQARRSSFYRCCLC